MNILSLIENLPINIVFLPDEAKEIVFTEVIAGDLMADLLVSQNEEVLLLTGLATEQAIRTADLLGAIGVLLVNEKLPTKEMKKLAEEIGVPLFATPLPMYDACVKIHSLIETL